jgi:hypothetical protein
MMPIRMRRKAREMEKVENLYRSARAQNDSINTSEQIRSRLRDSLHADGDACAIQRRPPQYQRVKGQQHQPSQRHQGRARDAARQQRHDPGRRPQADFEIAETPSP